MAAVAGGAIRTQVGIIGAGPAGLVLAHLLAQQGIDSVILEARSRNHVQSRVRAGVLEQGTVDLLDAMGVGDRMHREGLVHEGIELRFDRTPHRIDFTKLTGGGTIMLYGQAEIVKDLIATRLAAGGDIRFDVDDVRLDHIDTDEPQVAFNHGGLSHELQCDFIAGCDGFHGVSRTAVSSHPSNSSGCALTEYHREYPFGWLGILADVAPSAAEVTYTYSDRGFALMSLRSPRLSRLYLQVDPNDDITNWPDGRIWDELHSRLAIDSNWSLAEGAVLEKGITAMRSYVAEPLCLGRVFLAGDAAHIVPPTGAKGMNLAIADVAVLADAFTHWYRTGSSTALDAYSSTALRRVWRAQHFSWWMTSMLHRFPDDDPYQRQLQLSQLRYTVESEAAAASLAENYVGLRNV